jgi:hypothetical protein
MITGALLILVAMYLIELDPTQRRSEKAIRLEP